MYKWKLTKKTHSFYTSGIVIGVVLASVVIIATVSTAVILVSLFVFAKKKNRIYILETQVCAVPKYFCENYNMYTI